MLAELSIIKAISIPQELESVGLVTLHLLGVPLHDQPDSTWHAL
jgi:hypothetical protein